NTFVWLVSKAGGHHPMVIDPVWKNAMGAECSPPILPNGSGVGCFPVFRTFGFQNWSNMADAVSDGDSKIYMREAFIPNDNGPEFGSGGLITFR
ncbi:MAG TPA: hypothetical protein VK509_00250, partial [Polyangiales bacterium]|nr:hypothetical protein [Polyangiales bacterium]